MSDAETKPKFLNAPLIRYPVVGNLAHVSISTGSGTISEYQVHEPELTSELIQACVSLRIYIKQLLQDKEAYQVLCKDFSSELNRITRELYPSFNTDEIDRLAYFINRDARGLGKIQPLIDDPAVHLISILGPGQILTLQHTDYGLLFASLSLSETDIAQLIKKLCNRSIRPASNKALPPEIILRSGLLVKFSENKDHSTLPTITIEKPGNKQKIASSAPQPDQITSEYRFYHNLVRVRVCRSKSGRVLYQIGTIPLSDEEKQAILGAKKEDERRSGLTSTGGRTVRLSSDEFSRYLNDSYPLISDERHRLLYIALSLNLDPVRWIRLLMADHQVTRFRCIHPDSFILVCHKAVPREVTGCLKPKRADLNRFADFLIRSSGQSINPDDTEIRLMFKTGEEVTLNRVMDDTGHYYQIDFKKEKTRSDITSPPSSKKSRVKDISTQNKPLIPDSRIDDLIATIFMREGVSEKSLPESSKTSNQNSAHDSTKGLAGIITPIKNGIQTLISLNLRKKNSGNDKPPIPEIPPVPKDLNIQIEDGSTAEEAYWLYQPHSYVVITLDKDKERLYRVIEPELSPGNELFLKRLMKRSVMFWYMINRLPKENSFWNMGRLPR